LERTTGLISGVPISTDVDIEFASHISIEIVLAAQP
jgi:hypothetical protein